MTRQAQNMIKYIIKRILLIFPMLLFVLIITWLLSHMMSVNPAVNRIGVAFTDPEVYRKEMERIGFFDPWYIKLGNYLGNFFIGDWGKSYVVVQDTPVLEVIGIISPRTFELMIIPNIIVPIVAVKLGVISARNKDQTKDTVIRGLAILGAGFPVFWIAALLQMFVGYSLELFTFGGVNIPPLLSNSIRWFPPEEAHTGFRIIDSVLYSNQEYLWDTLLHMLLPTICMIFISLAGITRQTRSSMLDVLDQDYIRTARAKGIQEDVVINKHALRNALIPTSNLIIGGIPSVLLGSLFIEVTFNYQGFGFYMVQSIIQGDYLLINGLLVFATLVIMGGTLAADVMYTIIDPRITYR
ncbi:MAG: ABC transporter permease [Candidatus Thorarchaeota archaeon]